MQFDAEQFRRLCGEHGLAVTHQRQVIYQALMSMRDHPSPEAVYEKVRKQIPSISLVCVECKAIVDLDDNDLEPVRLKKRPPRGFSVQRYSVEVIGLCTRCAN
jgi:Fur family peroxide stress response transcriptional regulator